MLVVKGNSNGRHVDIRRFSVRAPVYQEADEVGVEVEEVEVSRSDRGRS